MENGICLHDCQVGVSNRPWTLSSGWERTGASSEQTVGHASGKDPNSRIIFYIFPQDFYFENFQIHRKVGTMNILLLFLYMDQLVLCHICSLSLYSYRPFLPNPFENKLQTSSTSSLTHQCVSRKTMDIFPKSHNTTVTPKKDDINSVK